MPRVWIVHEHLVYVDVLSRVLAQIGPVEIVEDLSAEVDVVLFSLDDNGQPKMDLLPHVPTDAKMVAFSSTGTRGLVRLPGEIAWQEVTPFGLSRMALEVLAGREQYRQASLSRDSDPPPTDGHG